MNPQTLEPSDGLPTPQLYWAALAVAMAMTMSVMDVNVVNVALPELARALQISESSSVWIVNAYNLSVLAFLLPCATLGERLGLQKVFRFGVLVFVVGSLGFMFSNTLSQLCVFKVFQGVGGAAMMSMMGGLTRFNYPARLFGIGIGINAMVVAVSSMAGPMVGSAILHFANWHWLSFLNIPIGLTSLFLSRYLAKTPPKKKVFDYKNALLSAVALCLMVYSLDSLLMRPTFAAIGLVVAFLCGWRVIKNALRQEEPLVPVDLLQIKAFRFSIYVSSFSFAASMIALVCLPFHLQSVFGLTQLQVGYFLIVWPLGSGTMALLAGRLSNRYPTALLAGIGACVMAFAMLGLAIASANTPKAWLLLFIALVGIGFGFFQTPNNKVMLSSAPMERSGAAGGIQATTRVFSQSVGATIVALALALPVEQPTQMALWAGFIFALIAAVINVVRYKSLN